MKIKYCIISIGILTFCSSCLRYNLEELPTYSEAKISGISSEYRYGGTQDWITGEPVAVYKNLTRNENIVDTLALTLNAKFTVPPADDKEGWTAEERSKVSLENITCYFSISTAAKMTPLEGAPIPGSIGNWNGPKKYEVMAGNGIKRVWTVNVTLTNNP